MERQQNLRQNQDLRQGGPWESSQGGGMLHGGGNSRGTSAGYDDCTIVQTFQYKAQVQQAWHSIRGWLEQALSHSAPQERKELLKFCTPL